MTHVDLTSEEQELLAQVLKNSLAMLEIEIVHTDHADFKGMLKHRREVLRNLLDRLPEPKHAAH